MTVTRPCFLSLGFVILAAAAQAPEAAETADVRTLQTSLHAPACGATAPATEHQYTVTGRIKLLLIWTGRREVGQAFFTRTETDSARRLALLVGTDPDRAPMRLNRWGYIAETTCDTETLVTGVMTEAKEQSVEQARSRAEERPQQAPLRAIRARVSATESTTETATISPTRAMTYQDLAEVLATRPAATTVRRVGVPPRTESGFLRAVTSLMHESATAYHQSRKPPAGLHRLYVHGGNLYDMTLRHSQSASGINTEGLESDFVVRNRATGSTTRFQISYSTSAGIPSIARRIVFRPRGWLELELLLKERP